MVSYVLGELFPLVYARWCLCFFYVYAARLLLVVARKVGCEIGYCWFYTLTVAIKGVNDTATLYEV